MKDIIILAQAEEMRFRLLQTTDRKALELVGWLDDRVQEALDRKLILKL